MPRRFLALSIAALAASLWGCAALSPATAGIDEMQVQARIGKPDTVRKNSDGSETWEYRTGPMGRQTYMVTVGSDRAAKDIRQVLTEEYFSRVNTGMSRDQMRQLLGKSGEVSAFGARDGEVWSWPYLQGNPMYFNVMFDRTSGAVRSTQRQDKILWMDHDC